MDIITLAESITILSVFKVLIIMLMFVYLIFAFLIMKQVRSMTRAVNLKDDFIIRILGIGHFAITVLVLLLSLIVL